MDQRLLYGTPNVVDKTFLLNELMRFLSRFSVLLLDMNGTFVLGHDRFGPEQDYFATYEGLGGHRLNRAEVTRIMTATFDGMSRDYALPEKYDDFPSLAEGFRRYGGVLEQDLQLLERVFSAHEMGKVPPAHAAFLRRVALSHHLGIVSNLWAKPAPWLAAFRHAGLLGLFKTLVFSSDGRSIKPSRALFESALVKLPANSSIVFAGDSLERDIVPAKALGLSTAWIAPLGSSHPAADRVVSSLPELALL